MRLWRANVETDYELASPNAEGGCLTARNSWKFAHAGMISAASDPGPKAKMWKIRTRHYLLTVAGIKNACRMVGYSKLFFSYGPATR